MIISLIVALDDNGAIGLDGTLPWYNPEDLQWFKEYTMGKTLVCGHRTYQTLPDLPGRAVINQGRQTPEEIIADWTGVEELVVIGGRETYLQWRQHVDRFLISRIHGEYEADVFLKEFQLWENPNE